MNIFLTGAAGYIGTAVARELLKAGHKLTGLTHTPDKAGRLSQAGVTPAVGDLKKPDGWRKAAEAADVLIHAAAEMSPEGPAADRAALEALIAAAGAGEKPRLLIYTSGVWVLGNTGGREADEASPVNPLPLVAWRTAHETLALNAAGGKLSSVVLRPGCVYGGGSGLFGMWLQSADAEGKITVVGGGENRWATVHLDDLARLYALIVEKRPARALFHGTDGSAEPVKDVAKALLKAGGKPGTPSFWPVEEARKKLGPFADALAVDQRISSARTMKELGWTPRLRSPAQSAARLWDEWRKRLS